MFITFVPQMFSFSNSVQIQKMKCIVKLGGGRKRLNSQTALSYKDFVLFPCLLDPGYTCR